MKIKSKLQKYPATARKSLFCKYPILRGMLCYAIIWPCSSITQEYVEFGTSFSEADWARAARFGFFGTFFMAPVFYNWMKYTQPFFKKNNFRTCMKRAAIEQVSYGPFALSYFLLGMSLMEMKSWDESVEEVKAKFWPMYIAGTVYWPTAQTLNFRFVPQKNRIIFVAGASFIWTVYMAHIKSKKLEASSKLEAKSASEETKDS